ncbi:hypothetical protein [Algoriphagus sp. Y33]|uniref:hypothetical protein n=1 Tax=Algoriphagus sp. Y33 TaxID=2772483 RepID=UPI00178227C3|nr:hypothetical protein [Algoriphagus sp. Y33]
MKKKLLLPLALSVFSISGFAQVYTNPSTGDVGIGTSSPLKKLHVVGDTRIQRGGSTNYLDFSFNASYTTIMSDHPGTGQKSLVIGVSPTGPTGTDRHIFFQAGKSSGAMQTRMIIHGNGNVGIGNTSPTYKLQVTGNSKWTGNASSFTEVNSNTSGQYLRQYGNDGSTQSWLIRGYALNGVQAEFNSGGINVNGKIKTKEVNVTASGWLDYVFRPGYQLMPLSELETFIHKNGHLPDVPTEAEVMENGVNLAEMNAKLLEKVEELTLYVLELQRKNEEQDELIKTLMN